MEAISNMVAETITLKADTVQRVLDYLGIRPWREVEVLIHEITNQIKPGQEPDKKSVEVEK